MEKLMVPSRRSNRLARAPVPQILFRRAAANPPPRSRRPCSSTQIQSRGAKRKYLKPCASWGARRARSVLGGGGDGNKQALSGRSLPPPPHTNNRCVHLIYFWLTPSWGAKRARSVLGSAGGQPALSVGSPPHPSACTDWANLGDGPAGLIAEFALASDVADYVRFRAACRSWRRCSPDPRASGLDGRFLPRQWLMLDKAHAASSRCHRFLNVSTGECIRTDLPELAEHTLLWLTPEGLLLLLHEPTLIVRLLNPLTRQLTDLPAVTDLLTPEQHRDRLRGIELGDEILVNSIGLVGDGSTVAVSLCSPRVVAIAKPGDKSWTVVDTQRMSSALPFGGRFYCATYWGVMVLDFSSDQQPPRLLMVAERCNKSFYFDVMSDTLHLVDNGGELMLVQRMLCLEDEDDDRKYVVFRVDLDAGKLIPVKGLNGRAVFMGNSRSISVSAETFFPSIIPNTIYIGFECDGETNGYNVSDGSIEPLQYGPLCPPSVVVCLCYCIQEVLSIFV